MSNFKIVKGEYLLSVAKGVIKQIAPTMNDLKTKHLCIVPDRFSLITEKLIFEVLGIEATFNISVLGINKLAKQVISNAGLDCLYITDEESKLLVRRAMQKTKKDFVCFSKHITYGVCEQVQKTLSQIKSSGIGVSEFKQMSSNDAGLESKLHDFALIFEEYENLLGERMDAPQILNVFSSLIESKNYFSDTKFFFVGFDSFTKQGYEIVEQLSKNCDITLGALLPQGKDNGYIYDTELYYRLKEIAKKQNKNLTEVEVSSLFGEEKQVLANNIFCYKQKKCFAKNNFANIYESSDMYDEAMFVAKKIVELVKTQDYRFNDFCICADSSYYPMLRNALAECEVAYFDDQSYNLANATISKFVENVLDLAENGFLKEDILKCLQINFLGFDKNLICDAINKTNEQGLCGKSANVLVEILGEKFEKMLEKIAKINKKDTILSYCEKILDILESFDAKSEIENNIQTFKNKNEFLEKIYLQIYEKIQNVFLTMQKYIAEEELTLDEFSFLVHSGLKSVEIRSVPQSVDCVFVGDGAESFYANHKILFVVGANEGSLPVQTIDKGLVSDKDIENLSVYAKIEPAVKVINKRNKFKLYDILLLPSQKLFISYKTTNADGKKCLPAVFVENIIASYKEFEKITKPDLNVFYIDKQENINSICFHSPNQYFANINCAGENVQNAVIIKNAMEIKKCAINYQKTQKNQIFDAKKLFFSKKSTKVSQIESYYSCPFLHFLRYGIKLKQNPSAEMKADFFGNFLHRFSQLFIEKTKNNLGGLDEKKVEEISLEIFERISKDEFFVINFPENQLTKNLLKSEAIRFANFINIEQSNSKFKPTKLEQYFGGNSALKICVENEQYDIVGIVDRIDEYDDYFRIVDYKTGSLGGDAASYASLYYGRKIQIFVYLKATENILGKKCFGVFYLPISNAYKKQGEQHYKMKGFFVDDEKLVCSADGSLSMQQPKSRFFEAELSTAKTTKGFKLLGRVKKFMAPEQLQNLAKYSIKLVENAIKEICCGNIDVSPFGGVCEYCEYKNICHVEILGNKERLKNGEKITYKTFEEVDYGDN